MHLNSNFVKAVGEGVSELVENVAKKHSNDVVEAVVKRRRPRMHEVRYEKVTARPKQQPVDPVPSPEEIDIIKPLVRDYEFNPNASSLKIIPKKDWELIDIYDPYDKNGRKGQVLADIKDPELYSILKFNSDLIGGRRLPNPPTRIVGINGEYPKGLIGANDDILLQGFENMSKADQASQIYHTLAHMYQNHRWPFMPPFKFKNAVKATRNGFIDQGVEGQAMVWQIRQNLLHYLYRSLGRMPTMPEYQEFVKRLPLKKINDLFGNLHGGQYAPNDLGTFLNALTRFAKKGLKLVKKTNA